MPQTRLLKIILPSFMKLFPQYYQFIFIKFLKYIAGHPNSLIVSTCTTKVLKYFLLPNFNQISSPQAQFSQISEFENFINTPMHHSYKFPLNISTIISVPAQLISGIYHALSHTTYLFPLQVLFFKLSLITWNDKCFVKYQLPITTDISIHSTPTSKEKSGGGREKQQKKKRKQKQTTIICICLYGSVELALGLGWK